jgi:hypothetical protein
MPLIPSSAPRAHTTTSSPRSLRWLSSMTRVSGTCRPSRRAAARARRSWRRPAPTLTGDSLPAMARAAAPRHRRAAAAGRHPRMRRARRGARRPGRRRCKARPAAAAAAARAQRLVANSRHRTRGRLAARPAPAAAVAAPAAVTWAAAGSRRVRPGAQLRLRPRRRAAAARMLLRRRPPRRRGAGDRARRPTAASRRGRRPLPRGACPPCGWCPRGYWRGGVQPTPESNRRRGRMWLTTEGPRASQLLPCSSGARGDGHSHMT